MLPRLRKSRVWSSEVANVEFRRDVPYRASAAEFFSVLGFQPWTNALGRGLTEVKELKSTRTCGSGNLDRVAHMHP